MVLSITQVMADLIATAPAPTTHTTQLANQLDKLHLANVGDRADGHGGGKVAETNPFLEINPSAIAPPSSSDRMIWRDPKAIAQIIWNFAMRKETDGISYKNMMAHLMCTPMSQGSRDALGLRIANDFDMPPSTNHVCMSHAVYYMISHLPRAIAGLEYEGVSEALLRNFLLEPYVALACSTLRACEHEFDKKLSSTQRTCYATAWHRDVAQGLEWGESQVGARVGRLVTTLTAKYGGVVRPLPTLHPPRATWV